MKIFLKKVLIIVLISFALNSYSQKGSFKVSGDRVQIGYQDYRWLGFGFNPSNINASQSQWGLEYDNNAKTLNFWKPYPSSNYGNCKLCISDNGPVGINFGNSVPKITQTSNSNAMSQWCATQGNMRLQIIGNVISHGYYHWSDSILKKNVEYLENCTQKLLSLKPKMYNYKTELSLGEQVVRNDSSEEKNFGTSSMDIANEPKHYGLFAQEVKRQFPNLVSTIGDYEAVNYGEFVTILIKGFQEQQNLIDSQSKKIDSLNLQIQQLRQEIVNWKGKTLDSTTSNTRLFQNNPNPFNGSTKIAYLIDESTTISSASIEIRNIMGYLQNTLTLNDKSGIGEVEFDGSSLTQGYYIYTLIVNGSIKDSKMLLKDQ